MITSLLHNQIKLAIKEKDLKHNLGLCSLMRIEFGSISRLSSFMCCNIGSIEDLRDHLEVEIASKTDPNLKSIKNLFCTEVS